MRLPLRYRVLLLTALAGCAADESERTWSELDSDERAEYMSTVVLPTMRDIFQAQDPERYANFSCATCHGENAPDVGYAMPNTLMALPLEGTLDAAEARDPEMTEFMLDDVFPTMVDLLGYEKFNDETAPDGFRCVGCHLVAE